MEALWYLAPVLAWAALGWVLVHRLRRIRRWLAVLLPVVAPIATLFPAVAYAEANITCSDPDCGPLMFVGVMTFAMSVSLCALVGALAGVMLALWRERRASGDVEAGRILRRIFVPLLVAALAGGVLVTGWMAVQFGGLGTPAALAAILPMMTMISLIGVGLIFTVMAPVVMMIRRRPRKPAIAFAAIAMAGALGGAMVGNLMMFGVHPLMLNLAQGLLTAAIWTAFNRDVLQGAGMSRS